MKTYFFNKASSLLFVSIILTPSAFAASSQVLLRENFENVTGLNSQGVVRTITEITTNNPNQLKGTPTPNFSNTGNGNASLNTFNVRRGDDLIDRNGIDGFDNQFNGSNNQFLVIGDDTGDLDGIANGGGNALASSTMNLSFSLSTITLNNPKFLDVSFEYAFDANNASNPDEFIATLVLSNLSTITLINHTAPTSATRGNFNWSIDYTTLAFPPAKLNFQLTEKSGNGSSAVGLDNIRVIARIPEPGVLSLLGISLLGLGLNSRQKA